MLRELRAEDTAAVLELFERAFGEARRVDADEVRSWLEAEWLDSANLRVLDDRGTVAGYVDISVDDGVAQLDAAAPGRWDEVFEWAEARARELGATIARTWFVAGHELAAVLGRRGYARVRSSFRMAIELGEEPPPSPAFPDGIDVRTYRHPEDEQATYEAQDESFRDAWGHVSHGIERWRTFELEARGFDPSLWFLAWDGDEVAGICLSFPERSGDPDLGWISILGVRRPWRRRGLGEALIRHAFRELHARGLRRIGLGVDAESPTGATSLYERIGMHVVVRSETWEKRL